jgi:8-oxo-dGTP diphosphatase
MLYRNKKPNDIHKGKWNGLGGKFDPGESPEDCVIREVYEESGLRITEPVLRGILTFPKFSNGEDWYVFLFTAIHFQGELIDSHEGQLSWIPNNQLAGLNLWPGDYLFLNWLGQNRFFSATFNYRNGQLIDHKVVFHHAIPQD